MDRAWSEEDPSKAMATLWGYCALRGDKLDEAAAALLVEVHEIVSNLTKKYSDDLDPDRPAWLKTFCETLQQYLDEYHGVAFSGTISAAPPPASATAHALPGAPDPFDVHASLYPPANPAAGDAKDKGDKAKETDKMATVSVFPDSGLDTMSLRTTYTYKRPISVLREHRQRSCRHQQ